MKHLVFYDDNEREDLRERIAKMCAKFRKKFGQVPTECLALPATIGNLKKVGLVEVRPKPDALVHHFWVGRNDDEGKVSQAKT